MTTTNEKDSSEKVKPKSCDEEPFTQEFILVYGSDNKKPTKNNCCSCYWVRCPIKRFVCQSGPMAENVIRVGLKCRSFQRRD